MWLLNNQAVCTVWGAGRGDSLKCTVGTLCYSKHELWCAFVTDREVVRLIGTVVSEMCQHHGIEAHSSCTEVWKSDLKTKERYSSTN